MRIQLYNFTKRVNSTKTPDGSGSVFDVQLKDDCSIESPSVTLAENPIQYNYAYIPTFSRYYFITDWVYEGGRWRIDLEEDLLASNKAAIRATSSMILYSSDGSSDIVDSRLTLSGNIATHIESGYLPDFNWADAGASPSVVLGITGKGSFGPILMKNANQIASLIDGVDDWTASTFADVLEATKQLFFGGSAASCVKSAIGLPILLSQSDVSGSEEDIVLGSYPCTVGGVPIKGYVINRPIKRVSAYEIAIPWGNGPKWRRYAPYSKVSVSIPFIGQFILPNDRLVDDNKLSIAYSLNVTSGDIACIIKGATSGEIVATGSGNIAIPLAYGNTGIDTNKATQAIGAGLTAAAGAFMLNPAMTFGGLSLAASSMLGAVGGTTEGSGGLGGGATSGLLDSHKVICIVHENIPAETNPAAIIGKPLMKIDTIGNRLSGYIQTDGFSLLSDCSKAEADAINMMMDRGIYLE